MEGTADGAKDSPPPEQWERPPTQPRCHQAGVPQKPPNTCRIPDQVPPPPGPPVARLYPPPSRVRACPPCCPHQRGRPDGLHRGWRLLAESLPGTGGPATPVQCSQCQKLRSPTTTGRTRAARRPTDGTGYEPRQSPQSGIEAMAVRPGVAAGTHLLDVMMGRRVSGFSRCAPATGPPGDAKIVASSGWRPLRQPTDVETRQWMPGTEDS